jgi:large subunit ribosomal protein L21
MYAVIATGGKQYRVENGTILKVEKLDAEPGATVEFGEVLLIGDGDSIKVGAPLLKGGKVTATGREAWQGREESHREVPSPQALPAPGHASPAVHAGQDHRHQRLSAAA